MKIQLALPLLQAAIALCLAVLTAPAFVVLGQSTMAPPTAAKKAAIQAAKGPTAATSPVAPSMSSPLKLTVESTEVGTRFSAYVGGGANISPPSTFDGGGGIPMISISNGSSFLAGEVSSKDGSTKFIRIRLTVANPTQGSHSFKIGDVALVLAKVRMNDFAAVGYGSKLCAMGDTDRKTVEKIVVDVAPGEAENLSYLFPLTDAHATQGQLVLGSSAPVTFEIGSSTAPETTHGDSSAAAKPEVKAPRDFKLTVITTDGATHDILGAEVKSENDLDLQSFGFSNNDLASMVILTNAESPREERMFIRREVLESRKETYHALILPMSAIDRIAAVGTTIRSPEREDIQPAYGNRYYSEVSVTTRDGEVLRAITSENLKHNIVSGPHELLVNGTEDLHDFGKAAFTSRLGDGEIKEIRFPPLPPVAVATKSPLTAVITEVGGRSARLSDLRFEGGTALTFTRTGSTVRLMPSDIRRIELHGGLYDGNTNAIAPDRLAATVVLNSGAQQDFEWKTAALVGRTTGGWYEWIPGAAIRTIDFDAAK